MLKNELSSFKNIFLGRKSYSWPTISVHWEYPAFFPSNSSPILNSLIFSIDFSYRFWSVIYRSKLWRTCWYAWFLGFTNRSKWTNIFFFLVCNFKTILVIYQMCSWFIYVLIIYSRTVTFSIYSVYTQNLLRTIQWAVDLFYRITEFRDATVVVYLVIV